ncbi:MAG: GAF domain-containing protein [Methylacidiphilales bacterium]|nr:GAF domain-containing protein [Candidatus Methylacidiphilales bacterium]NJR14476.1 GAF domain-containing protein [Calothrix sp. CSU_2_0]
MTVVNKQNLNVSLKGRNLLDCISDRIRRLLELEDILKTTSSELQKFTSVNRAMIYQFRADGSGEVVAESREEDKLPSLIGLNFPADDIPDYARELFIKSRVRSVVNVETQQIAQSRLFQINNDGDTEVVAEDFSSRKLDLCHMEYLTAMGVKSSLVMPLMYHDELWGLLVLHHSEAREFSEDEIEAIQMVVNLLSIAIAQNTILVKVRAQGQRQTVINQIGNLLRLLPDLELQVALEETVKAFGGSGGRLCLKNEDSKIPEAFAECLKINSEYLKVYTCGKQPIIPETAKYSLIEQYAVWEEYYQNSEDSQSNQLKNNKSKNNELTVWAISDIYQTPKLRNLQVAFQPTSIRSILFITLSYRQELLGYISIFRDTQDIEKLWAGQFEVDVRQLYPRQSFQVWKESKQAHIRKWTVEEIELAQELASQFATAIHEHNLYRQVHAANNKLETQVIQRTESLQQANEQQQILFDVVTKMRESLNVETIFTTMSAEVRRVLKADRVGVYYFYPESQYNEGEFIAEDVTPGIPSALAIKIHDHCFGEIYATKYRYGRVNVISNIYEAGLEQCFIDVLAQFAIQSTLVAPILKGDVLWGLLCIHQCNQPRDWQASEIQFATQISAQLSVAIEQADLLARTQNQAETISKALRELQQTQTQLIQTEKMSSLGQLVAGIAHEINNPVNFIYGNIKHISQYSEDLLSILYLYQQNSLNLAPEITERAEEIDLDFLIEDLPNMLSSIKVGTERIRQIVLSLRNFSRLDQAEIKPVDIHEGIDSTLVILQHRLKAKPESPAIQIIKEYNNLPEVECYAGQLNQVFMNVLSNAIDAVEERREKDSETHISQIRIQTSISQLPNLKPSVSIRISDNGLGIPEEIINNIFDPFFTTKTVGKGTGLGLSISYQIVVEKHGGIFKCHSQKGQGTEFFIEIPIQIVRS